ncbi:hypothetical protein [Oryza sativa Japonica Group]|uniref:Uncharacterized protein n=1 Tax=Oryza sativa subsp. japonica TaxID=39947 RepID=Q5ZBB8_ORYSJ|nr:hypothetical protein [Oryza sativa Japonica Group]BAD53110.1 hypothetical protein [Oryza sativa Japonica Group]
MPPRLLSLDLGGGSLVHGRPPVLGGAGTPVLGSAAALTKDDAPMQPGFGSELWWWSSAWGPGFAARFGGRGGGGGAGSGRRDANGKPRRGGSRRAAASCLLADDLMMDWLQLLYNLGDY